MALNKIFSIPFKEIDENSVLDKYIEIGNKLEGAEFPPCTKSCAQCLMRMRCQHSSHPEKYVKLDNL